MSHPAKKIEHSGPMPFEFIADDIDKNYLKGGCSENTEYSYYHHYQQQVLGVYDIIVYTPQVLQIVLDRCINNDLFIKNKEDELVGLVKKLKALYTTVSGKEYIVLIGNIEIDERNSGVNEQLISEMDKREYYIGIEYGKQETNIIYDFNFHQNPTKQDVVITL